MGDYYAGEIAVDEFSIPFYDGKATLNCKVVERWQLVLSVTISCATVMKRSLTQRRGVSVSEHEDLETTIKSSVGVPHLAELGSTIKSTSGREFHLEKSVEETQEFTFTAPECGRAVKNLYQKVRKCTLTYKDDRFFHQANWTRTVLDWLPEIHEDSRGIENDPACGCDNEPKLGFDGLVSISAGPKTSLLLPYVFSEDKTNFTVPELNLTMERPRNEEQVIERPLSAKTLPSYLLFLSAQTSSDMFGWKFSLESGTPAILNPAHLDWLIKNSMAATRRDILPILKLLLYLRSQSPSKYQLILDQLLEESVEIPGRERPVSLEDSIRIPRWMLGEAEKP